MIAPDIEIPTISIGTAALDTIRFAEPALPDSRCLHLCGVTVGGAATALFWIAATALLAATLIQ
jgi:hypothetical protein